MSTAADRRWFAAVAELGVCVLCQRYGVQVAHRNEGRGMGQKSEAWQTAALCPECHHAIDNGAVMDKTERRALMDKAIVRTHDRLIRAGRVKLA